MRLHVVSLPHTQTTKAYSTCAFTEKTRKFATMMTQRGHEVFLYAGEENEAECTEHVVCITKQQQSKYGFNVPSDYLKIDFNAEQPWQEFNDQVIAELRLRLQQHDIICVITSYPTKAIADAYPNHLTVEYGVGYSGIHHPYRVFESYAWRNYVYGYHKMDGAFFDEVIPNYFELADFTPTFTKQDYFLFVGRINANKGLSIAQEVCEQLGRRLLVAGPGEFSGYGEYMGVVRAEGRNALMSNAMALFCPTLYVPPFEGVHIEAQLCGTPVITTDFGVFSETVEQGVNGYRCKSFEEFCNAAQNIDKLDRRDIAYMSRQKYSTEVVAEQYERYFERLLTLHGDGWYNGKHKQREG